MQFLCMYHYYPREHIQSNRNDMNIMLLFSIIYRLVIVLIGFVLSARQSFASQITICYKSFTAMTDSSHKILVLQFIFMVKPTVYELMYYVSKITSHKLQSGFLLQVFSSII